MNLVEYTLEVSKILGKTYRELSMSLGGVFKTNFVELTPKSLVEFMNNTSSFKMSNKQTEPTSKLRTTIDVVFLGFSDQILTTVFVSYFSYHKLLVLRSGLSDNDVTLSIL